MVLRYIISSCKDISTSLQVLSITLSSILKEILRMIQSSYGSMVDQDVPVWSVMLSLIQGLFLENGPFVFVTNETYMKINPYSWNKKANVLYIESPGGVNILSSRLDSAKVWETTTIPTVMIQLPKITTSPLSNSSRNGNHLPRMNSIFQEKVMPASMFHILLEKFLPIISFQPLISKSTLKVY